MLFSGRRRRPWGIFDRKIRVEKPVYDPEGITGHARIWDTDNPVATGVPARLVRTGGSESFEAGASRPESDVTYRIRWMSGITTEQSVVDEEEYGGRWEIVAIQPVGFRHRLDLILQRVD